MNIEIVEKKIVYEGYFQIIQYRLRHSVFHGGWSPVITREIFERGDAAAVLPYDPHRDEIVFIEQFRAGALHAASGPWLMEIVAGTMEIAESAEAVVRRESVEESGCEIRRLVEICTYFTSPGGTSEQIYLFCGEIDSRGAGGVFGIAEEHEDIRVHVASYEQAQQWLDAGRFNSASAIISLQWLKLNRDRLRQGWGAGT